MTNLIRRAICRSLFGGHDWNNAELTMNGHIERCAECGATREVVT